MISDKDLDTIIMSMKFHLNETEKDANAVLAWLSMAVVSKSAKSFDAIRT